MTVTVKNLLKPDFQLIFPRT